MVATAARAPSISRRMKPTSSKSGATQAGVSSLRFRRAIGRSEAGGASKTFAQQSDRPRIAQRETHILKSGLALRHRLEDVKGPAMVSDLVPDRQFGPLEPPALVVILRHVAVPDKRHLALGEKRGVGDQCVDPALGFQ